MATRSGIQRESTKQASERIFISVSRAYFFWMLGLIIGALGIRVGSLSMGGVGVTVERPEIIQGIIYLVALWHVFNVCINIFQKDVNPYTRPDALRNFVWSSLPRADAHSKEKRAPI